MISQRLHWRASIRVSALVLEHCKRRAVIEGWQLSDLARVLVCLGATASFLRLQDPDALERFKTMATLDRAAKHLDMAIGKRRGRTNAPRQLGETVLLPLRLPRGLCRTITIYADTSGRSRNEVLAMFLERGLIIYLRGQNAMLDAIQSLKPSSGQVQPANR